MKENEGEARIEVKRDDRTAMLPPLILEQGGRITQDVIERIREYMRTTFKSDRKDRKGAVSATFGCSNCGKDVVVQKVMCSECVDTEEKKRREYAERVMRHEVEMSRREAEHGRDYKKDPLTTLEKLDVGVTPQEGHAKPRGVFLFPDDAFRLLALYERAREGRRVDPMVLDEVLNGTSRMKLWQARDDARRKS